MPERRLKVENIGTLDRAWLIPHAAGQRTGAIINAGN
jgi:hypothetical protein